MDFVSFSANHWEDLWQSRHHVMSRLAARHKVLFVSPPAYIGDLLDSEKRRRLRPSGFQQRLDNLYSLVPPKYLFESHKIDWLRRLSGRLRAAQIRGHLRRQGFQQVVLFVWNPQFVDVLGQLGEIVSCYYVDEEFTSYYRMREEDKQRIRAREDILLRNVDLVFANGIALYEEKSRYGNCLNVPMGVDFNLFSKVLSAETQIPADLAAIRPPRIGYIGNVNDKVDFELLETIFRQRPHWSLVLVGPLNIRTPEFRANYERLRLLPNVSFLGLRPLEALPAYLKGLDVCLMCYRIDGWQYYSYPLKLHEYLAGGKPVVGADQPSVREFADDIFIVRTPEEWLQAIERALEGNDPKLIERRVQIARRNTWDERVRVIEEALAQKIEEKLSRAASSRRS